VRGFLRSFPGWLAFQLAEYAVLFALAKLLLALGLPGVPTFVVTMVLAVALVVLNYNLRRRYLSDEDA
jgi:flagellar biosynthesis component FlhA